MRSHGHIAISRHLFRDRPKLLRSDAMLRQKRRVRVALPSRRRIALVERGPVLCVVVADGVDDLGELCGERRVLSQALATRLLLRHQCLKCRRPVNSIAMWFLFAVSIIIASRREPPGWMMAVTPARAATSIPSGNGK